MFLLPIIPVILCIDPLPPACPPLLVYPSPAVAFTTYTMEKEICNGLLNSTTSTGTLRGGVFGQGASRFPALRDQEQNAIFKELQNRKHVCEYGGHEIDTTQYFEYEENLTVRLQEIQNRFVAARQIRIDRAETIQLDCHRIMRENEPHLEEWKAQAVIRGEIEQQYKAIYDEALADFNDAQSRWWQYKREIERLDSEHHNHDESLSHSAPPLAPPSMREEARTLESK